jgi:6-phosphogluconolactonase (cycloisomerase 2 family)
MLSALLATALFGTPLVPPPQLSISGGAIGQTATFHLAGTASVPLFPEFLALGTSTVPGGIDLGGIGDLYVIPAFVLVGNPSHAWTFAIPNDPAAVGAVVHAQAAGWAFDLQTLQGAYELSNLASLTLQGVPPSQLSYALDPVSYTTCGAIAPNAPSWSGGTPTAFSVLPPLPQGLVLEPVTGVLSGTPTALTAGTQSYTISASNAFGTATTSLELGVQSILAGGLAYTLPSPTYPEDLPIAANAPLLPANLTLSYAVTSGVLPSGLQLSATTGVLSGTPTTPSAPTPVTITVSACDGTQASAPLSITISSQAYTFARAAFVCNQADDTISVLVQNAATGQLRHNGYVHTGSATGPRAIATNATGTFAFVACNTTSTLLAYAIHPLNGRLSAVGGPVACAGNPVGLAVDPLGQFLYAANAVGTVRSYAIAAGSGLLAPTAIPSAATGTTPAAVAVDPLGRYVYVANSGSDNVSGYAIQPLTGNLTPLAGSPFATGDSPLSLALDPSGGFLYVANAGSSDSIAAYAVHPSTGALTPIAGSPYAAGSDPGHVALTANGGAVYTANATGSSISVYSRNTATGVLSAGAAVPTGTAPVAVGIDPAGAYLYSVNVGDTELRAYSIGALGALTAVAPYEVRLRSSPRAIAFAPSPANAAYATDALYAANFNGSDLNQFAVDASTGSLTALAPPTVATALAPNSVSVHPTADYLYVTHFNTPSVGVEGHALSVSGAAVSIGVQSTLSGNFATLLDPSGRFAYLTGGAVPGRVTPFAINPATGALTAGTNATAGDVPRGGAVHPNGKWLYVANQLSSTVSQFQIDPSVGALTALTPATVATGAAPQSIAIDPTGRLAYVACSGAAGAGNGTLSMYSIHATSGALTALVAVAPSGLDDPYDVAIHPNGRFLYVADQFAQNVREYLINTNPGNATEDGALVLAGTTAIGLPVRFLRLHAAGTFLYVGSESAATIPAQLVNTYAVNSANGNLTLVDSDATGAGTRGIGTRDRIK